MKFCAMSAVGYDLRRTLLTQQQSVMPGCSKPVRSHSMKCLAFTNIMGKTNPGDRVDMDVSQVYTYG